MKEQAPLSVVMFSGQSTILVKALTGLDSTTCTKSVLRVNQWQVL